MIDRDRFPVDPWRLTETHYAEDGIAETLFAVSNGYLGLRGNHIEGRGAHEHGTFINGLHETWPIRHAEQAYGFAEVGQTIVNAPDAKIMRLYVDDEPLSFDEADVREYSRSLDMRTGVLERTVLWETPSGKRIRMRDERIVSFEERHLAILRLDITVENSDAPVTISCQLLNRQDGGTVYTGDPMGKKKQAGFDPRQSEKITERVLEPAEYWQDGLRSALSYRVADSGMTVAVVADHTIETDNEYSARQFIEPDIAKNVIRVQAKAGIPIRITKLVSYHSSRGVPPRELIDRCRRSLDRAAIEGVEEQFRKQVDWLAGFWQRSDVRIEGHDDLQQATRWCLFQLAQAAARADGTGVPAKGLTGSGYSGHYFWDTEIYVLPFLTYTTPQWARNALRARVLMLPAARRRAAQLNEAGALFPWRTINGEEASAYYAAGTAQYHINADINFALGKYVRATGDEDFLRREGVDVVVETARLWATLGFWRTSNGAPSAGDSFHIHGVTGPDEYTTVVNDNLFTNVMARHNLRYAARVVQEIAEVDPAAYDALVERTGLDAGEPEAWDRAAEAISVPFSESLGIHPQDAMFLEREVWDLAHTPKEQHPLLLHFHPLVIYRFQVLKQADVVLALFLQGNHFTPEEKLADFQYYDPLTTGDSTLSAVVQAILAAEVGYQDLALEYFQHALFVDLGDLHHNSSDGVHVASAGGVWTTLVCGFGGMRDHAGELSFDPRLPVEWPSLSYPLQWQGTALQVTLTREELRVGVTSGDPVTFTVRGVEYTATADADAVAALDDQGPVIPGRPTLGQFEDARRDDGTRLSASVPVMTNALPVIGVYED